MAKKKPFTVSPTGTVSTGSGPFTVSGDPLQQRGGVGYSGGNGNISYQVGASMGVGGPNAGISAGTGGRRGDVNYQAGVGANIQNGAGVQVGASSTQGEVTYGVGAGFGTSGTTIAPTVQFGQNSGARQGAGYGAMAGTAAGSFFGPWGAAAGSLIGSGVGSAVGGQFAGRRSGERTNRSRIAERFRQLGILDENGTMVLPDGTKATLGLEGKEGAHSWKDPSRRVDKEGNRQLFSYDTDYTNDMDFLSGMFGNTLSRMLHGGANKAIDQTGSALGNQFLGSVGYGADMSSDNFNTVVNNARSVYARAGIQSKEDALALANQMHADGRINDADYVTMQQSTNILFNNDYGTAQALMGGRWAGIETANKTPSQGGGRAKEPPEGQQGQPTQQAEQPRRGHHVRVITPAEALAYVQPFVEAARGGVNMGREGKPNSFMQTAASGLGILRLLGEGQRGIGNLWDRYREWTRTGKNPLDPQSPMLPGGGGNVQPEYGPFMPGGSESTGSEYWGAGAGVAPAPDYAPDPTSFSTTTTSPAPTATSFDVPLEPSGSVMTPADSGSNISLETDYSSWF